MRAVILFNPRAPVESATKGPQYAEASLGFDFHGDPKDQAAIARHLRGIADLLEAPVVTGDDLELDSAPVV